MSFTQELNSWLYSGTVNTKLTPTVGTKAPSEPSLSFPRADKKPVVVTFLRHCGCPFAEKTFVALRKLAHEHKDIHCIAVSHSDETATDKWADAVGGPGHIEVIVDHERNLYGAYGLGISSFWHVLSPWSMASVFRLGREDGIWNRPTESGTRWQTAGTFAIDAQGVVKYAHVAKTADDLGDMEKAAQTLI